MALQQLILSNSNSKQPKRSITYEKKLPSNVFIKIHRSTIVNKQHIQTIEHWFNYTFQLTLTQDLKYQVSRSYMKAFKQQLGIQ